MHEVVIGIYEKSNDISANVLANTLRDIRELRNSVDYDKEISPPINDSTAEDAFECTRQGGEIVNNLNLKGIEP
ncbi:hypothetical protein ACFL4X_00990 [Gemmatimonadota bacterium]